MSTLYNLATSIYYGAVGCDAAAQERAIGMAIDIGTDVAVVLSGGALSAAVYGAKTAAGLGLKGIKVGFKAALKAASAAAMTTLGRMLE